MTNGSRCETVVGLILLMFVVMLVIIILIAPASLALGWYLGWWSFEAAAIGILLIIAYLSIRNYYD